MKLMHSLLFGMLTAYVAATDQKSIEEWEQELANWEQGKTKWEQEHPGKVRDPGPKVIIDLQGKFDEEWEACNGFPKSNHPSYRYFCPFEDANEYDTHSIKHVASDALCGFLVSTYLTEQLARIDFTPGIQLNGKESYYRYHVYVPVKHLKLAKPQIGSEIYQSFKGRWPRVAIGKPKQEPQAAKPPSPAANPDAAPVSPPPEEAKTDAPEAPPAPTPEQPPAPTPVKPPSSTAKSGTAPVPPPQQSPEEEKGDGSTSATPSPRPKTPPQHVPASSQRVQGKKGKEQPTGSTQKGPSGGDRSVPVPPPKTGTKRSRQQASPTDKPEHRQVPPPTDKSGFGMIPLIAVLLVLGFLGYYLLWPSAPDTKADGADLEEGPAEEAA